MIPTHFRFKLAKEAKEWNRTTKNWIPIEEIKIKPYGASISAVPFAWIEYDKKKNNLEFSIKPHIYCKECKEEVVEKKNELCDYCFENTYKEKYK